MNIPASIYTVICSGKATYTQLQNELGLRDLYNLLEVIAVEGHNHIAWRRYMSKKSC